MHLDKDKPRKETVDEKIYLKDKTKKKDSKKK
jgi:hypothetical protein